MFVDTAVVTQYANQLRGLSAQQVELALSTKLLTTEQKQQIMAELGLIASEDKIQSELLQTALAQAGLSAEKQKAVLYGLNLINVTTGEVVANKACTKSELEERLALENVTIAQAENVMSTLGMSTANATATVSFGLLTKSIWANIKAIGAWLISNPVGWIILAGTAIAGTVALVDALTVSLDEAKENLEESSTAFNETTDEIESLNDELKTTEERIKELQKLSDSGTISVADEAELELLKEKNKELARQIALKQRDQIIEGKKTLEDAQELSTKTVTSKYETEVVGAGKDSRTIYASVFVEKELQNAIDKYNQAKELLNRDDLTEQQREYWEGILGDAEERASEMQGILDAERQAYLDLENAGMTLTSEDKERLEFLNDIDDSYLLWNHTLTQTRESFIALNEEQQKSILLSRLLKQGLSDEQANAVLGNIDSSNYNDLWDKDFTFTPPEMTDYATAEEYGKAYATAWLEGVKVVTNTEQSFGITEAFKEELDNTFSNQSTIQSAFNKIQEGSSLSADEVRKLIELCPQLSSEFIKTADGYTIGADKLIEANDSIVESTKQSLQERANYLRDFINNDYDTSDIDSTYEAEKHYEWQQSVKEAKTELKGLDLILSMFGLATEDTANKYSDMADEVSTKTKLITTAVDEMNDTGHISASTYAKIAEMGGNFADCLEIQNGQLVLNTEKLKELETQEYKNAISANNLAIAREALRVGSVYDSQAYEKFKKQLEEENAFYQSIIDEINGANGGGSTGDPIKEAFEKDMAETEHLHNMELMSDEEYYNALEKANNDHYKNSLDHESEYNSNLEKIFNGRKQIYKKNVDDEVALLDERLEKGFISAEQYKEQVIGLAEKYYGQGSKYYDTDFATENFETLEDKALNVDDQIYEDRLKALKETEGDSLESHNEFIAEWKALNKEIYKDLNPKKYKENLDEIEEYEEDFYKSRVENEKTYWENQQKSLEDYYDEKIKKLQDEVDEEERITKQKELQLNLIKAQQDLLNAKKNRNQLVFANGGFEYDYNQDDIISKTEAVADAEKDIAKNIRDTQIEDLENEKESRSQWFKKLIDKIDEYLKMLNGEVTPTESDTSILNDVIKATEGKDSDIKTFTSFSQLLDKMGISYDKEAVNKLDNDSTASQQFFNNIAKTPNMPNLTPAVNYNNSTVNNNSKVDIGNMTINVPEGTTKEQVRSMIDQFANNVIASLRAKATQIQ